MGRPGDDPAEAHRTRLLGFEWIGHVVLLELRSEEHTSELQSLTNLVCRLLLEKKNKMNNNLLSHIKKQTITIEPASERSRRSATVGKNGDELHKVPCAHANM